MRVATERWDHPVKNTVSGAYSVDECIGDTALETTLDLLGDLGD